MAGSDGLNLLSSFHNAGLAAALNDLSQTLSGINLTLLDINTLFNQAITPNNPFGFTNTTQACLTDFEFSVPPDTDFKVCSEPNEYLFWDDLHPTKAGHKVIGKLAFRQVGMAKTPEPSDAFGLLTLGFLGTASLLMRQQKVGSHKIK
jgi:phospholipase/lecithinase/hemolysin